MIVRCNQCSTEFGLDERQIGAEGMAVRCSVCKNVFRVETSAPKPIVWQVQTTDGTSFSAPNLATLREWIEEGRLHPDDKVSRTGRSWVRIGDMPEFASAFEEFVDLPPLIKPIAPPRVEVGSSVRPIAREMVARVPPVSRRPDAMPPTPVRGMTDPEIELEADEDERTTLRPAYRPEPLPPTLDLQQAVRPTPTRAPAIGDDDRTHQMVRPVMVAPTALPVAVAPAMVASVPVMQLAAPAPTLTQSAGARGDADFEDAPADFEAARRRTISPGLVAFLGVIAAVGIMFGVPSIRETLLGLGKSDTPADQPAIEPSDVPEIAAAEAATNQLGLAELARAEAALQRKLDAGDADAATSAAMKVALADLLLSRALAYDIAAALDEGQREVYRVRAREDREDGERLVDGLSGAADADRLAEVRAIARLAAGRDPAEVLPLVPEGARETEWIVRAAVLWRDAAAPVPEGLLAGLQAIDPRSGLADAALALALIRAGDEAGARNLLERLLVRADDQIVGVALRARLGSPVEPVEAGDETGETGETGDGEGLIAKAPPIPGETPKPPVGGGGGGGSSFDSRLERGCEAARNGSADVGIKLLLLAFDDQPNDLDVLVCLADGYARKGENRRAADFYARALDRSPKFKPALAGAAEVAAKTGGTARAIKLYETLLTVDPDNPDAKAYLAKHASEGAGDSGAEGAEKDPPPPPSEPSEG